MSKFTKHFRVFFVEEPIFDAEKGYLDNTLSSEGVWVIVPHLPGGLDEDSCQQLQRDLLEEIFAYFEMKSYLFWYYTPMALPLARSFNPVLTVYDCMDELSAFKNPPSGLRQMEKELFEIADIVFTGGHSLYQAKKNSHTCIFPFPSSIDKKHFGKARNISTDPGDQSDIPHPRIGFFGVIDERMDIDLLDEMACKRPDWHFIVIGPVVKIDPETLPKHDNLHFLGSKTYKELPSYLAGWDVAMMPFAINESTRYISPTKTPEYLAGGKPVVSTPIRDVVSPYGDNGLVYIANDCDEFIHGVEEGLSMKNAAIWLRAVDTFLAENSWEVTAEKMLYLVNTKIESKQLHNLLKNKEDEYV